MSVFLSPVYFYLISFSQPTPSKPLLLPSLFPQLSYASKQDSYHSRGLRRVIKSRAVKRILDHFRLLSVNSFHTSRPRCHYQSVGELAALFLVAAQSC
jgi:hypothetical protein